MVRSLTQNDGSDSPRTLENKGVISIYTYKEGLLSKIAHDLRLHVNQSLIQLDKNRVHVTIDANSLTVMGAMQRGKLAPAMLKKKDHQEIEKNIRDTVLRSRNFPSIVFRGTLEESDETFSLPGQLTMQGRTRDVIIGGTRSGDCFLGQATIQPSLWGISPFRALFGAIRLQDQVRISFEIPLGE
jgi:hypothetical protein